MYTLSQSKNLCIAFIYIKIRCSYSPGRFPRMTALGIAYEINASKLSTFFQNFTYRPDCFTFSLNAFNLTIFCGSKSNLSGIMLVELSTINASTGIFLSTT